MTSPLEADVKQLRSEMSAVTETMQDCIVESARVALDQAEYQERYDGLVRRFDIDKVRYEEALRPHPKRKLGAR